MMKLKNWLEQTEARWQNPPDFTVDGSTLKHLAMICDGNRRAAQQLQLHPYFGHRVGAEVVKWIARTGRTWGIDTITFWIWSTENWGRVPEQVQFIMSLAEEFLSKKDLLADFQRDQVRFTHLGRKDRVPDGVQNILHTLEERTRGFNAYRLNLALDYGGVDEIQRAVEKMLLGNAKPETVFDYLDTAGQPLPDLVIRSGVDEKELIHTSGFMPMQTAYANWMFLPDLFPNITPETLLRAIQTFTEYQRRIGK